MKKLAAVILTAAIALAVATPAFAKHHKHKKHHHKHQPTQASQKK